MTASNNFSELPKIGISQGDINGIGYEVILKTLNDPRMFDFCIPVIYGQSKVFSYYKKNFGMEELGYTVIRDADQALPKRINILNHTEKELKIEPGISTTVAGRASLEALKLAVEDLSVGKIDALVTAPINKNNIQSDSFKFHGHTEFISSYCPGYESLMLMVWGKLRVGTVTNHISIREVPDAISVDAIVKKIMVLNNTLKQDFNISTPKIAVLSLNPHAGDGGLLGSEEKDIIIPAIKEANAEDIYVFGPFPADGFFGSGAWTKYDGVLSMYHDQGMLPFKILAVDGGVNFTAGLPIVRTSPAHGTGYDIANKNIANPDSFRHAIFLAIEVLRNRQLSLETKCRRFEI